MGRARGGRGALRWWLLCCAAAGGAGAGGEPAALTTGVGGHVVMDCQLDFPFGHEIPYRLHWDKDGEPVLWWHSDEGAGGVGARWGGRAVRAEGAGLGGGALNVSSVREADAGLYRCLVTFPNRSPPARNNGTFYYLLVDGGNLIATLPSNVTVVEGARAELECRARSPAEQVTWARGGRLLGGDEAGGGVEVAANGSLVVRAADAADAGEYECRVRDATGREQRASAFLDVQYRAKIVHAGGERHLVRGAPASLDCHFSANPPLTNLRWEKDGFLFDPYNVPGVFYSRNGSLLFNQVTEAHAGLYSCTAYNALGTAGPGGAVRVSVWAPPALAARPQPLYLARRGDHLTLPCAPAPPAAPDHVHWSREYMSTLAAQEDGRALAARHRVAGGNLTLAGVRGEDAGAWLCRLRAPGGELLARALLVLEDAAPRAPAALRAVPGARGIQLTWRPGSEGATATVWYRARGAAWRTLALAGGAAHATLPALRARSQYEVRVLEEDALGDGLFSRPLLVTTLPDAEEGTTESGALVAAVETDGEADGEWGEGGGEREGAEGGLQVSVQLVAGGGALVRWAGGGEGGAGGAPCRVSLRRDGQELFSTITHDDYALVPDVEEGADYWCGVSCAGGGGAGGAALRVPAWGRLRAVAGGCAGGALLLAAAGGALLLRRRRAAY